MLPPVLQPLCGVWQVAERSLFLWNNEYIVTLVAQHRQVILPVVFNALESNARSHWNPAVHGLTSNVKKVFQEMDMNLWRECEAHYHQEEVSFLQRRQTCVDRVCVMCVWALRLCCVCLIALEHLLNI